MSNPTAPVVGIVMGSDSDWPVMEAAAQALDEFEIPYEVDVVSAHRMPREMVAYGENAHTRGLKAIIAGSRRHRPPAGHARLGHPAAGDRRPGAAALPGRHGQPAVDRADAHAACRWRPSRSRAPATAGLLAVRILAAFDPELTERMTDFQAELNSQATEKGKKLRAKVAGSTAFGFGK